jgi:aldose 1-epimerase
VPLTPTNLPISCCLRVQLALLAEQNDTSYFGPITGRVGQRISRGRFVLDGKVYHLERNDGRNTLHGMEAYTQSSRIARPMARFTNLLLHLPPHSGGGRGFHKVIWTVEEYMPDGDSPYITFYYRSFDGEQGFPGNLDVYVTYRLSAPYTLGVHMNATALDRATPVNLLLHTYWNLGGHGSGDVLGHTLGLFASRYTVLDVDLLPSSGRVAPVAGTPFDFRAPTAIGARIRQVTGGKVVGYDANYVIDGEQERMRPVAQVQDGASGRAVELWANQATVQLYTGNWLNNTKGKDGKVYNQYAGFTLETMGYVDAVNHPEFPSQTLLPGQEYKHDMVLKFSF